MDSFSAAHWLIAAGLLYIVWRVLKPRKKTPEQALPVDDAPSEPSAGPRPETYLARWRVTYVNFEGETSERIVRITKVMPRLEQFGAWCELREGRRTFNFAGFRSITDATTQQPVDLREWLDAQAAARKRKRAGANR